MLCIAGTLTSITYRHKECELMTAKDLLENLENDTVDMDEQCLSIGVGGESGEVRPP